MNSAGGVHPTLKEYTSQMSTLLGNVNTYATSLDNTITKIVNSSSGVMAGLSSTVLKEDLAAAYGGACYRFIS